ncbi:MAG: GIY-YIG nuclease family protein [Candidatus Gastranaerophilaceae bacterium]|jgi:putative endonuclease
MSKDYYVYILTNYNETAFYIGFTNDLIRRVYEHKQKFIKGHSQKYNLIKLVHYEIISSVEEAILREKKLKNWHREWKINLIKRFNPEFKDLYEELIKG